MALPDTAVLLDAAVLRVLQVRLALALVPATPIFLRGQSQMQDRLGPEIRVQHPVIDLLQCADVLLILEIDWVDL